MPISWNKQIVYDTHAVQIFNPVPELIQTICKLLPANIVNSELAIIITELYNNSVDHGLLNLSSEIKQHEGGLEKFYNLRKSRLGNLLDGAIELVFHYEPSTRILSIEVSDTGNGYNFSKELNKQQDLTTKSGRGLYIIKKLSKSISYISETNTTKVEYIVRSRDLSHRIEAGLTFILADHN